MRGRRFEENDFEALPAESDYVSPFAVQPSAPATMDSAYTLPPEVLAQLADLGITPEEVAQYVAEVAPMAAEPAAASPLAVQAPVPQYVEPVAVENPYGLNRRFENDFAALPAESEYVSPLAVQAPAVAQYVEPVAAPSPLAVQPAAAQYVEPDQAVRADDSRMPEPEAVSPFAVQPAAVEAQAASPLAVQLTSPEVNPAEVSPLAVQGPVATQPDLSQFQNFNPLDGADFSGAFGGSGSASSLQSAPTSFAFPENYGNPKNKIYNLTASPDDAIRLKLVDGTTIFEGQGPEAAAKAAEIVQQLGKEFGTQSTWILDKKPAGGDWAQVSQDTVGEKKKTALNSFLDVAAPIAGAALAFVPGIGPVLSGMAGGLGSAGAAAIGAAGGSLLNSGLQNQNSAEAFKKAAIAAGTTFLGAKIAPSVTGALKGLTPATDIAAKIGTDVATQGAGGALTQAGTGALADGISELVVTGARKGLTALGGGFGAGAGSALTNSSFNPDQYKVDKFKVEPRQPTDPVIDELVVTGTKTTPLDKAVSSTGSAFTGSDFGKTLRDTTTFEETATEKPAEKPAEQPAEQPADKPIDELVVTAKPLTPVNPLVATPVILPNGTLNPDFVNKDFTVDNPEGKVEEKTALQKAQDWIKANPLEAASLGLSLFGGAAAGGSGTSGSGVNTLSYAPGKQPGTPGSLGSIFSSKLPTANPALAVTPRDMGQRDWLRYGMGPEASFFSNVPQQPVKLAKGGFAVRGAGTGRSDDIPAVLSDGEYVMDAETVAMLGDGSNKAGAEKLDQLRVNLRRHKGANLAKGRFSVNAKSPEKYLAGGRA